jgi:hypothetical protein
MPAHRNLVSRNPGDLLATHLHLRV